MTSPRHLWSGEWRRESAETSERLAERRGTSASAVPASPAPASAGPASLLEHLAAWRRERREAREARRRERAAQRPSESLAAPFSAPAAAAPAATPPAPARASTASRRLLAPEGARPPEPAPLRPTPAEPAGPGRPAPRRRASGRGSRQPVVRALAVVAVIGAIVAGAALGINALTSSSGSTPVDSTRAWLGVEMSTPPFSPGALVTHVAPGSPGERAGLAPGDLITAFDNQSVSSAGQINDELHKLHPGDQITLGVERGGASYFTEATLTAAGTSTYP